MMKPYELSGDIWILRLGLLSGLRRHCDLLTLQGGVVFGAASGTHY